VRHAAYMPGKNLPWLDRVDMVIIVARVPHGTRRCSCDVHPLEIRVAHPRQPPAMKSHVVRHLQHSIITTTTSSETESFVLICSGPPRGSRSHLARCRCGHGFEELRPSLASPHHCRLQFRNNLRSLRASRDRQLLLQLFAHPTRSHIV